MFGWRHYAHPPNEYGETSRRAVLVIYPPRRRIHEWRRRRAFDRWHVLQAKRQAEAETERLARLAERERMDRGEGEYAGLPEALAAYKERETERMRRLMLEASGRLLTP